ncbi:MAG: sortase B protein-sorting domain-containing protein [Treponema sp.]|nr:sortase B protein-sorting domain-containing protein [Treponema sp.]
MKSKITLYIALLNISGSFLICKRVKHRTSI